MTEVQTRDDEGGLRYFPNVKEAMDAAKEDTTIWKISWSWDATKERIRLVKRTISIVSDDIESVYVSWVYEPIDVEAMAEAVMIQQEG